MFSLKTILKALLALVALSSVAGLESEASLRGNDGSLVLFSKGVDTEYHRGDMNSIAGRKLEASLRGLHHFEEHTEAPQASTWNWASLSFFIEFLLPIIFDCIGCEDESDSTGLNEGSRALFSEGVGTEYHRGDMNSDMNSVAGRESEASLRGLHHFEERRVLNPMATFLKLLPAIFHCIGCQQTPFPEPETTKVPLPEPPIPNYFSPYW